MNDLQSAGNAGEYYTPRAVTSFMVDRIDPKPGEKVSNCNRRQLYDYTKFYRTYPQIVRTVSAQFKTLLPQGAEKAAEKVPTVSAQLIRPPENLINRLSYGMFKLLTDVGDDTKRAFYEIECIRGNWSVRELKRQINSLYYERSGLSKDKKKLAELARSGAETAEPKLNIRDPYIFEFLGLKSKEVMSESALGTNCWTNFRSFSWSWATASVLRPGKSVF